MTRVKICGITNHADAQAAVAAGADAVGFVWAPSPRRISPEAAAAIRETLPPTIITVAVVMDAPLAELRSQLAVCPCSAVQLHGHESPQYVRDLRWGRVVKGFRIRTAADLDTLPAYADADAFLLDAQVAGQGGGTGVTFDWRLAQVATTRAAGKPIIVAGGLTPDNIGAALAATQPYAVDVSSGVERAPGRKDHSLMREFVRAVREFDARPG